MKPKVIKFPLFDGYEIGLFIDQESFIKYLRAHNIDHHDDGRDYLGCVLEPKDNAILLFVGDDTITTAAHESLHAAMCLLSVKGVNYDYDNQEILAYTQQYILAELLALMGYDNILIGDMSKG